VTTADPAAALIARFGLAPHPEGGRYRRLYCSATEVDGPLGRRPAVTTIVYLLRTNETSRWHRVGADEIWHFYEGAPLSLLRADPELDRFEEILLGPAAGALPVAAVPAGHWQAARSQGAYSLLGCTVAPGFDFADFTLLADHPLVEKLRAHHPAHAALL
jgi:uncharacterized protein